MSQKENEPSKSFFASVFSFDFCSSRPKTSEIQVNTALQSQKVETFRKTSILRSNKDPSSHNP